MAMSLIYPNIVPENNLRLPDALKATRRRGNWASDCGCATISTSCYI
jgi:hypothetical protein